MLFLTTKLISAIYILSWKNLENKISDKRVRVLSAWEELQTILGLVDVETKWLSRLNNTVEEHKKQKLVEHKSLSGLISNFEVSKLQIHTLYFIINNLDCCKLFTNTLY